MRYKSIQVEDYGKDIYPISSLILHLGKKYHLIFDLIFRYDTGSGLLTGDDEDMDYMGYSGSGDYPTYGQYRFFSGTTLPTVSTAEVFFFFTVGGQCIWEYRW